MPWIEPGTLHSQAYLNKREKTHYGMIILPTLSNLVLIATSCFLSLSLEGRSERPAEVPRVSAVMFSRAAARLCAAPGASGARCGLAIAPSPARPAPARETRTGSRGAQQDQERQKEPNRIHRASTHGSGEKIRETEIPLDPGQVRTKEVTQICFIILYVFWSLRYI